MFFYLYLCTGLSLYPRVEKAELSFRPDDDDSFRTYTKAMKEFLDSYDTEKQTDMMMFEDCGGTRLHMFSVT